jgi:outer membrane protein TolC
MRRTRQDFLTGVREEMEERGYHERRCAAVSLQLGALLLAGCAAAEVRLPEPERPAGPLSLEGAVDLALRNSPDVLAAAARVREGSAAVDEAWSHYWPVLQLVERFTQTDTPSRAFGNILDQRRFQPGLDFNDPGVTPNFHTGLAGSFTLYDGGRRRARVEMERARGGALLAREETVRRDLAREIARAFYLVFKARDAAANAESSIGTLEAQLRVAEARVAQGAARRSDELAVKVRIAEAREAAVSARGAGARGEAALHSLLGLGIEEPLELLPPPETQQDLARREELLRKARALRFEVAERQLEIRAARARVREARAAYFPELTIFGSAGFDDRDPGFSQGSWTWGVSLSEGLFEALRAPHRVKRAEAGLSEAMAAGRKALLAVELDVENALLDAREAGARHDAASQAVLLGEEALRLVKEEYAGGAADVSRLLESELDLRQARTRLRAAALDRGLARVMLSHAVGEYPAPPRAPVEVGRLERETGKKEPGPHGGPDEAGGR